MPKALAVPRPVEGWGLLLMPNGQIVKRPGGEGGGGLDPGREAKSTVAMQTIVLVFILIFIWVVLFWLLLTIRRLSLTLLTQAM